MLIVAVVIILALIVTVAYLSFGEKGASTPDELEIKGPYDRDGLPPPPPDPYSTDDNSLVAPE